MVKLIKVFERKRGIGLYEKGFVSIQSSFCAHFLELLEYV